MEQPHLHISLLGEFSLLVDGKPVTIFSGDRPLTLLAYLLLHRHTPQSRQQLAFTLWPDSTDNQARTNLRNLLYNIRQTLPAADSFLAADTMSLQWRLDSPYTLDVAHFEAALTAAQTAATSAEQIEQLEKAVALYKGDLLPHNYDDWVIPLREELHQSYLEGLRQLLALYEQQQAYRPAIRVGQRLLQQDPLDETTYVQLMRLYALSGDRAGVRRIYDQCVATLSRELDIEPSPTTQAAYEQLRRLETLPAAVLAPEIEPIAHSVPAPRLRPRPLPAPTTRFIGREAELAHIAELLADPACRLLTIVGPGGIGKTRLALQTAIGHKAVFTDGVLWVSLNSVQTAEQIAAAIAEALQYRLSGTTEIATELCHMLADKQLLLVLDNFEHLLDWTGFLAELLDQTEAVKLLVTSRQTLYLQQEWRFELGELPLPDEQASASPDTNSAMLLFEESARRTSSTFKLTAADYPAVSQICHLVGGMPLGIELAASWTRLLSCVEIVQEIEKSLDFLTTTAQNAAPRHRSLRAVFDYSWELLPPAEQAVLVRLAIFHEGFTREAAAEVAGADLVLLSSLADRSLIQRTAVGRYSLHNVIRQYTLDRLQADTSTYQVTAQQHSHYYLHWLLTKDFALRTNGQIAALPNIALELANIRVAWWQAVKSRESSLLRQAAFQLFYFYELRGLQQEGEALFRLSAAELERTLTPGDKETQLAICDLRTNQSYFMLRLGQITAAETTLEKIVDQLRRLEDEKVLSYSLRYWALALAANGRLEKAVELLHQSLELARRYQRHWEIAITQAYLGFTLYDQGRVTAARQHLVEALALSRELGDVRLIFYSLMLLGRNYLALGELSKAQEALEEGMALAEQTGDPYSSNIALHLGLVKQAQGDLTAARQLLEKSSASFARLNDHLSWGRTSIAMGFLELADGNSAAAQKLFCTFLQTEEQREHGQKYNLAAVIGLAMVRAQRGEADIALRWTGVVLNHPGLDWETQQQAEGLRDKLQKQFSAEEIKKIEEPATQQSFEQILQQARRC